LIFLLLFGILLLELGHRGFDEVSFLVNKVRELTQMLENRVLLHALFELGWLGLLAVGKNGVVDFLKAAQRVDGTAFTLGCLEEVLGSGVESLVRVLSRSSSSSAGGRRVSELPVGPLGVLLLHMRIESGVR